MKSDTRGSISNAKTLRSRTLELVIESTAVATANAVCDRLSARADSGDSERHQEDPVLIRQLLTCYDRIEDVLQIVESQCGASKQRRRRQRPLVQTLRHIKAILLKALEALDIHPMDFAERVDFGVHEPVHVLQSKWAEDDGRISEVVRRGFTHGNRVVRLQQVVVLKFVPRHGQQEE